MPTPIQPILCVECGLDRISDKVDHGGCSTCYYCGLDFLDCDCPDELVYGPGNCVVADDEPSDTDLLALMQECDDDEEARKEAIAMNMFDVAYATGEDADDAAVGAEVAKIVTPPFGTGAWPPNSYTEHTCAIDAKTTVKWCRHGCMAHYTRGFWKKAGNWENWRETDPCPQDLQFGQHPTSNKPIGSSGSSAAGTYGTYQYKPCEHAWQKFRIGSHHLRITASKSVAKAPKYPDLGVYLDSGWKSIVTEPVPSLPPRPDLAIDGVEFDVPAILAKRPANTPMPTKPKFRYPAIVVSWADGGVVDFDLVNKLGDLVWSHISAGKTVETGCIGAHGRTGTFLAMLLMRFEHLTAIAAIETVRKRHCKEAIESRKQVEAIFAYGRKQAKKLGIKEEDVVEMVREVRGKTG